MDVDPNLPIPVMTIYDADGNTKGFVRLIDKKDEVCHNCHEKEIKLQKCARCGCAMYCSRKCQKDHWKNHKKQCDLIVQQTEGFKIHTVKRAIKAFDKK
jgi:hypothetical protein